MGAEDRSQNDSAQSAILANGAFARIQTAQDDTTQDQDEAGQAQIEEIVVTASKRGEQRLQEVPNTIQALGEQELVRTNVTDFTDFARRISGLSFEDRGPGDKRIVIRGLQSVGASTTGVYFDEIVISGNNRQDGGGRQAFFNLVDMQRIEVLKGPQSTLYGASSMTGTIRFIPNRPNYEQIEGFIEGEASTVKRGDESFAFRGALNVPIVEDKLAVRAVGYAEDQTGFIDEILLEQDNVNNARTVGGRLHIGWNITPDINFRATGIYQDVETDGRSFFQPVFGRFKQANFDPNPWREEAYALNGTLNWATDHGDFLATTSFFEREVLFNQSGTRIVCTIFGGTRDQCINSLVSPLLLQTRTRALQPQTRELSTTEVRYSSDWDIPFEMVGGFFYQDEEKDFRSNIFFVDEFGNDQGQIVDRTVQDQAEILAFFGEGTWNVTPELDLLVGARWFEIDTNLVSDDLLDDNPPRTSVGTERDVTFKFNASYQPTRDLNIYATASEGFRRGGNNEPPFVGAGQEPVEIPLVFSSDNLWNYELGMKANFLDERLNLNLAAFYIDWENLQLRVRKEGVGFVDNVGEARIRGVEFGTSYRATSSLTLGGNVTFLEAELAEDEPENIQGRVPGNEGDRIPRVPRWKLNVFAEHLAPVDTGLDIYSRADFSYQGESFTRFNSDDPEFRSQGDFALVDLRLGLESDDGWRLSAFAENVFDVLGEQTVIVDTREPEQTLPVRPREIGLRFRYDF